MIWKFSKYDSGYNHLVTDAFAFLFSDRNLAATAQSTGQKVHDYSLFLSYFSGFGVLCICSI